MKYLLVLCVLVITQCASKETTTLTEKTSTISMGFAMNRKLTLEPCGCSFDPTGGIDREWKVIQEWNKNSEGKLVYLNGGTSFAPPPPGHENKVPDSQLKLKAETLVRAMNGFNVKGLGITADDFYFGLETVAQLKNQSKFPWVATNLKQTGGELFKPYLEFQEGNTLVTVFSVTPRPSKNIKLPKSITWAEPVASLQEALKKLPAKPGMQRLNIVLSNLSDPDHDKLWRAIPQIHLVVGKPDAVASLVVDPLRRDTLFVNPDALGERIAKIDFAMSDGAIDGFYNEELATFYKGRRNSLHSKLSHIDRQLASLTSQKGKTKLQKEKSEIIANLKQSEFIPLEPAQGIVRYTETITRIDKKFDGGEPTPMQALVDEYKAKVHDEAMEE